MREFLLHLLLLELLFHEDLVLQLAILLLSNAGGFFGLSAGFLVLFSRIFAKDVQFFRVRLKLADLLHESGEGLADFLMHVLLDEVLALIRNGSLGFATNIDDFEIVLEGVNVFDLVVALCFVVLVDTLPLHLDVEVVDEDLLAFANVDLGLR